MAKKVSWIVTGEADAINAMQKAHDKDTKSLSERRAILAASCVLHMVRYENATLMTTFVNRLPADARADSVVKWAVNTGLFKVGTETIDGKKIDVFKKDEKNFDKAKAEAMADEDAFKSRLLQQNAWVFDPPKDPFKGYNATRAVWAVLNSAKKIMEDEAKASHEKNDFSIVADLEKFLKAYPMPKKEPKVKAQAEVAVH